MGAQAADTKLMSHAELAQDVMSHPLPTVIEIALLRFIIACAPDGAEREYARLKKVSKRPGKSRRSCPVG